jgi:serine protease Do
MRHVQERPVPPSRRAKQHIPPEVDALVMACLEKDPSQRPNAEELLQMTGDMSAVSAWNQRTARKWWEPRIAAAVIAAMLCAVAPALAQSPARAQAPSRPAVTAADLSASLENTAQTVAPSVVEIFTTYFTPREGVVPRTSDLIATDRASGSGVILDPDGYIVTNAHVVSGAQRVRVEVPVAAVGQSILAAKSQMMTGQIVGIDLETDIAVIKVEGRNLPALTFGDSDELRPGQLVLAVGSPLGFRNTVSLGVVSAIARQLEPDSPMIYVQTDAPINQGSSGGPLVDLRGRVVGINTLILTQTGGYEGLGFAAPANIVRTVYEQLRKTGRVRRGDIGVRPQTITPTLATGLGLSRDRGVVLADVLPGSPAARAGLRPGDLVLGVDGKPMENGRQLQVTLYRRFVGDVVTLEILRGSDSIKVPVAIGERAEGIAGLAESIDPRKNLVTRLGLLALNLNPRISEILPVLRVSAGVVVASIAPGAIDAKEGGLMPGDVIYAVNGKPIATLEQLRAIVDAMKSGDAVVLHIERHGELMFVAFTID